jgi:catechol 2,3-dioxygenase-like lactoylglutathione lyase family enzyme
MMTTVMGNHAAIRVQRAERDRIRRFYGDVLGAHLTRELPDKDDFRLGEFHLAFLYAGGDGRGVDEGVVYAASDVLSDNDFRKSIFLELKTGDVADMRRRIVDFGVEVLDVPDPHLYFQAPGGQVFRLVGIDEDLTEYEGSAGSFAHSA